MRDCWLILALIAVHSLSVSPGLGAQSLAVGDTLLYGLDMLPADPNVANLNNQGFWNFSSLNSPFWKQVVIRDAGDGEFVYNGLDGLGLQFVSREDGLYFTRLQARINGMPVWSDQTDLPWKAVPLEEGQWFRGETSFNVPVDILAAQKDASLALADSARIVCAWEMYVESDARGTLQLQDRSTFESERHKYQVKTSVSMTTRRNSTWTEAPMGFDIELPGIIKSGIFYAFWSDEIGAPIGSIEEDDQGRATRAMFLSMSPAGKRIVASGPKGPDIIVNPNPSFGDVRFELFNLEQGKHRIEIYSIIGVLLRTFELDSSGSFSYPVSLSELNKGTYIYRLVDSFDKTIKSKRLVIITP